MAGRQPSITRQLVERLYAMGGLFTECRQYVYYGKTAGVLTTGNEDGRISRATGTETRFGRQADSLADTAVWTWFTIRHEHNRWLRGATFAAWGATVVAVTAFSFAGGAMRDVPRSRWIRPAAAVQLVFGTRIALKQIAAGRGEPERRCPPACPW